MRWLANVLILVGAAQGAQAAEHRLLQSPGGTTEVQITFAADGTPAYRVNYRGHQVIAPSRLGLMFERYQSLGPGMVVTGEQRRPGEDRYTMPAAKVSSVTDRYSELVLSLAEPGGEKRRLEIDFRAYDDGVAFRYRLPAQAAIPSLRLTGELSEFRFPADYGCHALNLGRFDTSHEGEYDPVQASAIRAHHLNELPVVCQTGRGDTTLAIAEADLRDYSGSYLGGLDEGGLGLATRLTPRPDDPRISVALPLAGEGVTTPWRVVMLGETPGRLVESTLITSLNPPAQGDFTWVRAGKTAWDWWNGPTLASVPQAGMNDATIKGFIDFAAANALEYMLIDDGWYVNSGAGGAVLPGADNLTPVPAIDLPGLVRYASGKKVGLWLWAHWKLIDANMDTAFARYAAWGIKGVKVDFMDRTDQEMVGFYHRLLATAAKHKLLVDLHGAYRPTGLIRTYPHYLTQEGVFGAEYNKWTRRVTARHNVTLPFTRMLLGPMDYTPGGFRNMSPAAFTPVDRQPQVQTTRGHGLAQYVVYDSPFQSVSDSPDVYAASPDGMDFIRLVPAAWDETRVLSGRIGEHVVIARRKGRDWYVGAMTNEEGRTLELPLDFLGTGRFAATIWQDGATPTTLRTDRRTVGAADRLTLTLAATGGAAVRLTPAR